MLQDMEKQEDSDSLMPIKKERKAMYAVKRDIYQGSDGVQVDSLSSVKGFVELSEAERIAANCGGRVIRIIPKPKRVIKPVKNNQKWMRGENK